MMRIFQLTIWMRLWPTIKIIHLPRRWIMSKDLQIQSIFRLTPMQQGILFHSLLDQTSYAYFEQVSLTLNGLLEVELLDRSLSVLFERHEILRSNVFHVNIEEPKLIVFRQKHPAIHFEDISSLTQSDQVAYIEQFVQRDKANGFDITRDELFRVSILQCASDVYKLIVSFHHIIMDGWCLEIVLKEWFQIYTSLQKNEPVQLGEAPSYEKYLKWLDKQDTDIALTFWERYLDGFEQQSILPANGKGSQIDYDPQQQIFSFDSQLTGQLESLAKELKVTLSTLFHSIWGLLLMKYNNTRDVVFGSVVSGRPSDIPGAENMVGLFINTIPVRISSEEDHLAFSDFVQHVQHSVMEAGQHHYVPLADIQAGSLLKSNLIHHILAFENFPGMEEASDHENENSLAVSEMAGFEQTNYSFNLNVVPGEKLRMKFSYNGLLYEPEYIDRLGRHVEEIARTIVSSADIVLHEIDIILPEEKEVILKKFNGTAAPYPREKTIHQLFEEQVERTPEHPAALYQDRQLTYRELNAQANRVAHVLRKKGIGPDQMVGIAVHRSLEMIVGLLGILKAGGAYLPLHPEDPEERLGFMLEDSGASILLTQRDQLDRLRPHGVDRELIAIEDLLMEGMELTGEECGKNPEPVNRSSDLVYVIYTSGSTGKPKGVMIEHASLINRLYWMEQRIPFGAEDVILQKTPYTFDVSLWELFSWAIQGATVCFLEPGGEKDPATIVETVEANGVTAIHFVPSMLGAFLEYIEHSGAAGKMRSVRRVFASGEALMTEHVRRFNRLLGTEGATLHNLYGPTEATVEVAYYDCPADQEPESIPIGKPIDNVKLYILDHKDRLQPVGVPGELHIGGDCVARGYVNRKELTEEKFVEDP
ncbi:amino acid adenylation domain-containing protein, partial [Paenibacillus sp. EKM101P]